MNNQLQENRLAIFGGIPLMAGVSRPQWPEPDEQTASALMEIYWSGHWSFNGKQEQAFASAFAALQHAEHGVFVANGSVALQCALQACGITTGDEVIVPACTWPTTASAAVEIGAIPVFVDIDPSTLCIDPQKIEAAITERTRAIIPVHLYGSMADMSAIIDLADRYHLHVIEDCAHIPGGKWDGRGVGSLGHVGTFAFSNKKVLTAGEGGMCITNDTQIANRLFRCSHSGFGPTDIPFRKLRSGPEQNFLCHNFRATEFQATILLHQLERLEQRIATYNASATRIREGIGALPGMRVQTPGRLASPQSFFGVTLIFEEGPLANLPLDSILEALAAEGLREGIEGLYRTYGPVYRHKLFPVNPSRYRVADGASPITDQIAAHALVLPHPWLGADEQTIEALIAVFQKLSQQAQHLLTQI